MSNARNLADAETRFVNATGDTVSGNLVVNASVGVGTSSPAYKLDARLSGTSSGAVIQVGNTGSGGFGGLGVSDGGAYPVQMWGSSLAFLTGNSAYGSATERMGIDSAGRVTMPYQPAWCYNTRNNWTNNQFDIITFSSYWNISGSRYQGSYTTGTFTAPVTGIYQVNFTDVPYSGGSSSAYVQYNLYKNGAGWVWLTHSEYGSVRNYEPVSASCVIELAAGDTIAVGAYPSGMNNNNAGACTFSGYLIG